MSLVAVPIYNTPENQRDALVRNCLKSLASTVNWDRHRLFLIDDCSTDPDVERLYEDAKSWLPFTLIRNAANNGTARSVNAGWLHRRDDEPCCKADSDIVFCDNNWLDKLEECLSRDPLLGVCSLRRRDLQESPYWPDGHCWKSQLIRLPGKPGERVHTIERVAHCVGSCQLYSPELLKKMGWLVQWGSYSLDDSLAAVRCAVAGMYSAFYCGIDIDHPDPGDTPYQTWKQVHAGRKMAAFSRLCDEYRSGKRSIWHGPDEDLDVTFGE